MITIRAEQSKGEKTWFYSLVATPYSLLILSLFTFLFSFSTTYAQRHTIQTAAFRDYRDAIAAVNQLRTQGFDAYSEFAMGDDGQQYARVRIGCFDSKETAELTVQRLIGSYTKEAASVELTPGAPVQSCLMRSIGFIVPTTWYIYVTTPEYAVFMVDFQGKQAFIKFDGTTWQMGQNVSEIGVVASGSSATGGYFSEVVASPYPQIIYNAGMPIFVTYGRLLWQRYDTAIITEGNTVVAYRVTSP